jgi:hypothetical protein
MDIKPEIIDKCIRWYLTIPNCERIEIHGEQRKLMMRILNNKKKAGESVVLNGEVNHQAFNEALYRRYLLHHGRHDNRSDLDENETIRLNVQKKQRKVRPSKVHEKISITLFSTIKILRENGLSWKKVSNYIAKYHKRKISSSYMCQVYTKMVNQKQELEQIDEELKQKV